jgi:thiamine kinase-like enzyme
MQKGKLIGQGRTAEIFELNENKIIKLFRSDFPIHIIENEYNIGKELTNKDLPIPEIYDLITIDNRVGIVYEKIKGPTMMGAILSKPWRIKAEARRLAELHKSIQVSIKADITFQYLRIKKNIQETGLLSSKNKAELFDYLETLPKGEILCHGDFHPDNIIISTNKMYVIDWMGATIGNPLADVARTSVMLKFAIVPEHVSNIKKGMILFVREVFYKEYVKQYIKLVGENLSSIEKWELPIAAARLVEWIPEKEKEVLIKYVENTLSYGVNN